MSQPSRLFRIAQPLLRPLTWGDAVVFISLAALIYLGVRPAGHQRAGNQPLPQTSALLYRLIHRAHGRGLSLVGDFFPDLRHLGR